MASSLVSSSLLPIFLRPSHICSLVSISFPRSRPSYIKASLYSVSKGRTGRSDGRAAFILLKQRVRYLEGMFRMGQRPDPHEATQLVYALCEFAKFRTVFRVLLLMATYGMPPDHACFTYVVNSLCTSLAPYVGLALQLVENMEECGFTAPIEAYNDLIKGLYTYGNVGKCLQVLDRFLSRGMVPNDQTYRILLEVAYKEGGFDAAEKLLGIIESKDGKTNLSYYNTLIWFLCKDGRTGDALNLFGKLPAKRLKPNAITYVHLMRRYCEEGRLVAAEELLAKMRMERCKPNVSVYNIFVEFFAFHDQEEDALELLDRMSRSGLNPTTCTYNPILALYCKKGKVSMATQLVDRMIGSGLNPNSGTSSAIASLCARGPDKAKEAFGLLMKFSNKPHYYRKILHQLCKTGDTYAALLLLGEMIETGYNPIVSIKSLLMGLCLEDMRETALQIIGMIEEDGWMPSVHYYNHLMIGLCNSGRVDLAIDIYEMMVGKGCIPNNASYEILVEGLAKQGRRDLTAQVLKFLYRRKALRKDIVDRIVMMQNLEDLFEE